MPKFKLICCVVNMGDASKVIKIAKKHGIKQSIISIGRGTLNSRLSTFLKINEMRREIVSMVAETEVTSKALAEICNYMNFEKPHHGIAFTHSVSAYLDDVRESENTIIKEEMENCMYKAIYVIVERGQAEDVIDVANKAGARGGTIVNARGSSSQEVHKLFSIEIEPEKEQVIIITKSELKNKIVEVIKNHTNIDQPGNGIIYVMDVNEVYGLHKD